MPISGVLLLMRWRDRLQIDVRLRRDPPAKAKIAACDGVQRPSVNSGDQRRTDAIACNVFWGLMRRTACILTVRSFGRTSQMGETTTASRGGECADDAGGRGWASDGGT